MLLFSVFLPLVNFLLFLCFGALVHQKRLSAFVIASMFSALAFLISMGPAVIAGTVQTAHLGVWVASGLFELNWNFSVDALTYVMLIVVFTVSTLVHLYSTEYMSEDPHLPRFMSYLSLFTFFMLILITSDNFIGLFLGWEGVGLCSYLLISFWFTRIQANKAAIQAMIVNRIADLAFTVGVLAIFYTFQSVEFNVVFGLAPYFKNTTILFANFEVNPLSLICVLLFLGACGKSAQIGLHTWLPSAMEGWHQVGLSIKIFLPYAGTTSLDMLVNSFSLLSEKSNINEVNPQETDKNLSDSSETLRKTITEFNFDSFLNEIPPENRPSRVELEWFIGFTEGSGGFTVRKDGYLIFQITQPQTDIQILYQIRKILGFGTVFSQDEKNTTWRIRVHDKINLKKIIYLFNGNLLLAKNVQRFTAFLTAFNLKYNENVQLINNSQPITINNGWLAGFTDAEGCFTVSVMEQKILPVRYKVSVRYILAQRSAEAELKQLAPLLDAKVSFQKSYPGHSLVISFGYLKKILNYFTKFPLKTKKRLSLYKFRFIYARLLANKASRTPLTDKEILMFKKRAREINKIENLIEDKVRSPE